MNKIEYLAARKILRENGTYSYQWLDMWTVSIFKALSAEKNDELQERAEFLQGCTYKSRALKQWLISNRSYRFKH